MDRFYGFRPSAIFYYIKRLFLLYNMKPENITILTVVNYSVSRDAPSEYELDPKLPLDFCLYLATFL